MLFLQNFIDQNTLHPHFLQILKQFLQILKVAGKRKQTKTRFQPAKRERLRSTKCKVAGLIWNKKVES